MQKAIRDLPLLPSKTKPQWRRHQRTDGSEAFDFGKGPIESKVMQKLLAQVNQTHKGRTLQEKVQAFKDAMEAYHGGDKKALALPHPTARKQSESVGIDGYLKSFEQKAASLPHDFNQYVPEQVKRAGDDLIKAGETGYNIDSYGASAGGDYSHFLRQGYNRIVYHNYTEHPDHAVELLKRLRASGLAIPYDVATLATSVKWDESWPEEKEVPVEKLNGLAIGRSVQYALVFKPEDKAQADKLVDFFEKNAEADAKNAIDHSWQIPDWRSSFAEKVDEFQPDILNVKPYGDFELLILTKDRKLPGFQAVKLWLNAALSQFIKATGVVVLKSLPTPLVILLHRRR